MKGFILVVKDGEAALRFVGYDGEEGHKRSHALREEIAKAGCPIEVAPVGTSEKNDVQDKGTVSA